MKKIYLLGFTLFCFLSGFSQNIYLNYTDGNYQQYVLAEIKNIRFSGDNMLINFNNGNVVTKSVFEIESYNYKAFTSSEPDPIAIEKLKKLTNFKLYPNPTNEILLVDMDFQKEGSIKIEILDYNGKIISSISKNIQKGKSLIDISTEVKKLTKGIYFCKIVTNKGIITENIIKK